MEEANLYICKLFQYLNSSDEITNVFDVVKYDNNIGIYLIDKLNDENGYIITKILYPTSEKVNNIVLAIIAVDGEKLPKNLMTRYFEIPITNEEMSNQNIKNQLLEFQNSVCL